MINFINITLVVTAFLLLILILWLIYTFNKKNIFTNSYLLPKQRNQKVQEDIKVEYLGENVLFDNLTKESILGVVISSDCDSCLNNFEFFIKSSKEILPLNNYFIFIHKEDTEFLRYIGMMQKKFNVVKYDNHFISDFGIAFFPTFFLINKDRKVEIFTPICEEFLWKVKNQRI
ncbi:hypothetical protein [Cytobacillus kochii]|uniref:hypothetical protein n=1 Tax=Cytobacillus kochii TaxID=859143 RepID=UPI002041E6C3|nr:hypothetical protein [Cytobacillus kochii]MCM3324820.1 hypothetical protein [Cytobacillus kochii]MCM3347213.1 hypothetical protein [Cytobacillus kochii]